MVFCYKIITESACASPRKASPARLPDIPSSLSHLLSSWDYEACDDSIINDIPEREWRLLATLARKRDREIERERLADQFHRMWQKEKEERNLVVAETSEQYRRYLHRKREKEKLLNEVKSYQRQNEEQLKTGLLIDSIRYKERRTADLLAMQHDKKIQDMIHKAVVDEARLILAKKRKQREEAAEQWRKKAELMDHMRRAGDARSRKDRFLKNTSRRVAIENALSMWESSILKQEQNVMEEYRRAQHAARAQLTTMRSESLAQQRQTREKRARRVAAITAQLRDVVRMTKS